MWDLQLQCFDGLSINMKYFNRVEKAGRFTQLEHGKNKLRELLYEAEKNGFEVIDTCYFSKDRTKTYALQLVRQGIPLFGEEF